MKLHGNIISPYVARVVMACGYKGLEFEMVKETRETMALPAFKALNPMSKMPAFVDGDVAMAESLVICEYLDSKYPEIRLIPADIVQAAKVRELAMFGDLYVQAPILALAPHMSRKVRVQEFVDATIGEIARGLDAVNVSLGNGRYAVGDSPSIADCVLVVSIVFLLRFMEIFKVSNPLGDREALIAYWDRMQDDDVASNVQKSIIKAMDDHAASLKAQKS